MVRKQFIEAVVKKFGERLTRKKNEHMDSYYLDRIRKGRGVFWIDYQESGNKGYRIHLQKVKSICDEIQERGYGEYPLLYLSGQSEINDILRMLGEIISHIDGTDEDKGSLGSVKLLTRKENKIRGIVTAQQCKHCGHHEIGITTEEGRFLSLKPGMKVQIVPKRG